jgi:hypothetical protein
VFAHGGLNIQEFRSTGVQEFRSFRSTGVQKLLPFGQSKISSDSYTKVWSEVIASLRSYRR